MVTGIISLAVWGSLAVSIALSVFFFCQTLLSDFRRRAFFFAGCIALITAFIDFFYQSLGPNLYEVSRIIGWSIYGAAMLYLLTDRITLSVCGGLSTLVIGFLVPIVTAKAVDGTSLVIPLSFLYIAIGHFSDYRKNVGFASSFLMVTTLAISFMCAMYQLTMQTADPNKIAFGYLHYVLVSAISLLFGWVQFPRDIKGKTPVKIEVSQLLIFATIFLFAELLLQYSLIWIDATKFTQFYMLASVLQLGSVLFLHFIHRHKLVIFTDDVVKLLDERTKSLQQAQATLSTINQRQALTLIEQEKEIDAQAIIIERQKRLELAAQTAGQIAHDIQNLVSPVLHRLDHISETDTKVTKFKSEIELNIRSLFDLNSQLLGLSRRGRIEKSPVHLNSLFQQLSKQYCDSNVTFLMNGDPLSTMLGSQTQLFRAISNLIENGLDAAKENHSEAAVSVQINVKNIEHPRTCFLGKVQVGKYAEIIVSDSGCGISPSQIETIFEPFYSTKKLGKSGSGLGLTIVASVIEDHNAALELFSRVGETSFTIYIPIDEVGINKTETEHELCHGDTVLVSSCDSDQLSYIANLLEKSGVTVVSAQSLKESIKKLQIINFDAIIIDPKLDPSEGESLVFSAINLRPGIKFLYLSDPTSSSRKSSLQSLGVQFFFEPHDDLKKLPFYLAKTISM